MNKLDVLQQEIKAKKDDDIIQRWYAQTRTGLKILGIAGDYYEYEIIDASKIKRTKRVITCYICNGHGCFICNDSGITTRKHIEGYRGWQQEDARLEAIKSCNNGNGKNGCIMDFARNEVTKCNESVCCYHCEQECEHLQKCDRFLK